MPGSTFILYNCNKKRRLGAPCYETYFRSHHVYQEWEANSRTLLCRLALRLTLQILHLIFEAQL